MITPLAKPLHLPTEFFLWSATLMSESNQGAVVSWIPNYTVKWAQQILHGGFVVLNYHTLCSNIFHDRFCTRETTPQSPLPLVPTILLSVHKEPENVCPFVSHFFLKVLKNLFIFILATLDLHCGTPA